MLRELIHYRFEEWGDGAVEAFAVAVDEFLGDADIEALLGTGEGYIEFAGILLLLVYGGGVEVRVTAVNGIIDDDIVKFKSLSLVYR